MTFHLTPLMRFRIRLILLVLFLAGKIAGSLYWIHSSAGLLSLLLVLDVLAGAFLIWLRHRWFRTPSPYDMQLRAMTLLGLFTLILLHKYHLAFLDWPTNSLFFIPVMVAAFDFGVWGGLVAGMVSLTAELAISLASKGIELHTILLGQVVPSAILYGGISVVMGRLVDELVFDRERYRLIVEESEHPIVRVDRRGRVTLFNAAAERATGVSKEQVLGRPEWKVAYGGKKHDESGGHLSMATRALETETEERGLLQKAVLGGQERYFLVDTYLVRSAAGRVTGAFAIHKDVTELKRKEASLREAKEEMQEMALTDPLTGLGNRRAFKRWVEQDGPDQAGQPLAVMLLDIDHFKKVNDTHGHLVGDEVLKQLGDCMREAIRDVDLPFRFGGEEFAVLLPGTDQADAVSVAERVRRAVKARLIPTGAGPISVTLSVGLAVGPEEPERLVQLADQALYEAKGQGRDQVCVAPPPATQPPLRDRKK